MPPSHGASFLDLPMEIRHMIYALTGWDNQTTSATASTNLLDWRAPNNILHSHSLIQRDLLHYWSQPTFTISFRPSASSHSSFIPRCMLSPNPLELAALEIEFCDGWQVFVANVNFRAGREDPRVRIGKGTVLERPESVVRDRELEACVGERVARRRGFGVGAGELEMLMRHLSDLRRAAVMGREKRGTR